MNMLRGNSSGDGVFAAVCRGVAAGLVGTAAMTLSTAIEARLRGRESSDAPAQAAGRVLAVEPSGERGKARFSRIAHWGYGTSWGAARGLLDRAGLEPVAATGAHLGVVWGTAAVMLPALDAAPPVWEWGATEVGIDLFHHVIYATATGVAYEAMS